MMKSTPIPPYTLYYVFRHLRTPVRLFGPDQALILEHVFPDMSDAEYFADILRAGSPMADDQIMVISIEQEAFYALIPVGECMAVVGPVRFSWRYTCRHCLHLSQLETPETEEAFSIWLPTVREVSFRDFIECLLLLSHSALDDPPLPVEAREKLLTDHFFSADAHDLDMKSFSRLVFDKRESNFVHNPYNHEFREVDAIERGDLEMLEEIIREDFSGRYGTLSEDPLRQEIDMGIVVVTLASRAAIRGGLSPEAAFYLSDTYIQALEKCETPLNAIYTSRRAERHYTRLVKELKPDPAGSGKKTNPHIDQCKDYVYAHLHRNLQVQDIASAIGLEANYLSALFRKCEHITLKQYIMNAKIRLVQNLLTYSDYNCIEIASYLGFSSQSHMGDHFRRVTGMTPGEYRKKYRKDDFLHDYK